MNPKEEKKFLSKLRRPVHISYIAQYILRCEDFQAREIIGEYIENDIIEESSIAKDYYVLKSENK